MRFLWIFCLCPAWMIGPACADTPLADPALRQRLDATDKQRRTRTPADQKASRELIAEGDRAYREKKYPQAFMAYANAHPNDPTAYAFLMAGDAHWRSVVQAQDLQPQPAAPACKLDNRQFPGELSLSLTEEFELGLALARHRYDPAMLKSPFYARASEQTRCLSALASRYKAEPAAACVDIEGLRACLGAPLID